MASRSRFKIRPLLLVVVGALAAIGTGAVLYFGPSSAQDQTVQRIIQSERPAGSVSPEAILTAIPQVLGTPTALGEVNIDDGPTESTAYLQDALDFIQKNSIMSLDWQAWRAKVLAEAGKPQTRADTHFAIRDAIEMLGDHHSHLLSPDEYLSTHGNSDGLWIMSPYPERIVLDTFGNSYRLGAGLPGPHSALNAGVHAGDVITAINGQPTDSMGASQYYRNLFSGSHIRLTLERRGQATPVVVALDHPYVSPRRIPEGRRLPGNIGYVRLPDTNEEQVSDQYPEIVQQIIRDLDQPPACGWVVDLQENDGGYFSAMAAGIGPVLGGGEAGALVEKGGKKTPWSYGLSKEGPFIGLLFAGYRFPVRDVPSFNAYELKRPMPPVAVLTDRWTASAAEAVLISFRGRANTRTFGEATFGIPTANSGKVLSDGAELIVTSALEADRTGKVYGYDERIQPDQVVASGSPEEQGTDADPVLAAGARWLRSQPACAH